MLLIDVRVRSLPFLPVVADQGGIHQVPALANGRPLDQILGDMLDPPEGYGQQHGQAGHEQKSALPFEAGFADNTFDRAIGHGRTFSAARGNCSPAAFYGKNVPIARAKTLNLRRPYRLTIWGCRAK